jgi:hypothetical protein
MNTSDLDKWNENVSDKASQIFESFIEVNYLISFFNKLSFFPYSIETLMWI